MFQLIPLVISVVCISMFAMVTSSAPPSNIRGRSNFRFDQFRVQGQKTPNTMMGYKANEKFYLAKISPKPKLISRLRPRSNRNDDDDDDIEDDFKLRNKIILREDSKDDDDSIEERKIHFSKKSPIRTFDSSSSRETAVAQSKRYFRVRNILC